MPEYFIETNSFAAPFCPDRDFCFIEAKDVLEALQLITQKYSHPCGLYSAFCYRNADSYHKKEKPLGEWLSNEARAATNPKEGLFS